MGSGAGSLMPATAERAPYIFEGSLLSVIRQTIIVRRMCSLLLASCTANPPSEIECCASNQIIIRTKNLRASSITYRKAPTVGLEPTTTRLRALRSTD